MFKSIRSLTTKKGVALAAFMAITAAAARATDTDPVATVTSQFGTLQSGALTIGGIFLAFVGVLAIIALGAKFLKRH